MKLVFFFYSTKLFFFQCIYFIFGCTESSLLVPGLSLVGASGAALPHGTEASHCSDFSCRAQGLGRVGFSSCAQA